jgi:hypothetical protein
MAIAPIIAPLAAIAFVCGSLAVASGARIPTSSAWIVPAALSAAFLLYSAATVAAEGPLGFWPEHTRNLWGAQIWIDLLLGVGTAWALLVPEARRVGVRPLPWLVAIVCTGSIGLLAMFARVLYQRTRRPA